MVGAVRDESSILKGYTMFTVEIHYFAELWTVNVKADSKEHAEKRLRKQFEKEIEKNQVKWYFI